MTSFARYRLALASYWLVFIIVPAALCFLLLGASSTSAGIAFGFAMILFLIGEWGFRGWKRLWKLNTE
jgi:hypothetical protein